jgi:putative sigma-54 modulation protein
MQVIVKARHTRVPDSLKEQAVHKIERVRRFFDRITKLEIEFSEEHNPRIADKHTVEVILTTKAHVLRAHASGPDPASAVDLVVDKIEAQAAKLKDKIVSRRSRPSGAGRIGNNKANGRKTASSTESSLAEIMAPASINGAERPIQSPGDREPDEEGGGPRITRVKRFAVKPMTAEEAILQMESLGHDFYLFVNAESEQAGVVYRRRDGSFGLIEPD